MIRRSITAKMSALVVIPLVALIGLWLFATGLTIGPARDLRSAQILATKVGDPVIEVVAGLQGERRLSVVRQGLRAVSASTAQADSAIAEQRGVTDAAIAAFLSSSGTAEVTDSANAVVTTRLAEFRSALAGLPAARASIDVPSTGRAAIMQVYTALIDSAYHLYSPLAEVDDPELGRLTRTLVGLSRAREFVAQEDALVSGVAVTERMTLSDITEISGAIGAQRRLFADAAAELPAAEGGTYASMREKPEFARLAYMEDQIIRDGRDGRPLPIDGEVWRTTAKTVQDELSEFELAAKAPKMARAGDVAKMAYLKLALAGVAGLGAVLLALWIGLRVARSVTGRLRRLRDVARMLAESELPSVVTRLRHGEKVDPAEADRTIEFGLDEIGEVGHAFSAVRTTAVHAAIEEASLRHGLNEVFLNVARRSQTLLHRQLTLLDRMERRSHEPQELEDLFRLDHLATRMRRHAEDLVILAGGAPGRGWRHPVPAVDVVRGAISEIEEYIRVTVERIPEVAISGRAVGDIIHLLAELVENGTSFSPPHTRVVVSGEMIGDDDEGYHLAITIEDRGLGMSAEALAEANERLAVPPDFDPANSARLGLLVVGRLASRHGISVRLRRSSYGGVSAVVVIPEELVTEDARRGVPIVAQHRAPARLEASVPAQRSPEDTVASTPDIVPAPADVAVEVSADLGGLPQRRRTRAETPEVPGRAEEPTDELDGDPDRSGAGRTPHRVRATMTAFQSGTATGRAARGAVTTDDADLAQTPQPAASGDPQ